MGVGRNHDEITENHWIGQEHVFRYRPEVKVVFRDSSSILIGLFLAANSHGFSLHVSSSNHVANRCLHREIFKTSMSA